jgi:hypothetical protein
VNGEICSLFPPRSSKAKVYFPEEGFKCLDFDDPWYS